MDQVIALIRELAQLMGEVHAQSGTDNFKSRQLRDRIAQLEKRADSLLPEKPDHPPLSPDRPESEWNSLIRGPYRVK